MQVGIYLPILQEEAKKIFAIPKNVILDEDKYNTEQYSDQDIIQLKKEVAELEKELLRVRITIKCQIGTTSK